MANSDEIKQMGIRMEESAVDKYVFLNDNTVVTEVNSSVGDHVVLLNEVFAKDIAEIFRKYNIEVIPEYKYRTEHVKSVKLIYHFQAASKETGYVSGRNITLGYIYVTDYSSTPLKRFTNIHRYTGVGPNVLQKPEEKDTLTFYILRFIPKYKDNARRHLPDMKPENFKQAKNAVVTALKEISNNREVNLNVLEKSTEALEAARPNLPMNITRGPLAATQASKERLASRSFFSNYNRRGKALGRYGNVGKALNKLTPEGLKEYQESRKTKRAAIAAKWRGLNKTMRGKGGSCSRSRSRSRQH